MTKLTIADLTEIARQFLRDEYGLALEIPIKRNNRLRSTLGAFVHERKKKSLYIELSGVLFEYADDSVIVDVLKHECIHYALYELDRGYIDGNSEFEGELKRLCVRSNYDKDIPPIGKKHIYKCIKCGREIRITHRQAHKSRCFGRVSRCCRTNLKYVCDVIYDGTGKVVTQ